MNTNGRRINSFNRQSVFSLLLFPSPVELIEFTPLPCPLPCPLVPPVRATVLGTG